jgi:hypothetical protein
LNNLVEKSTADAILILLPAYTGPAPFTIFATVALVLTPVLSGLAILLPLLRQNQQVYAVVEDSKSNGSVGAVETTATDCDTSSK